MKTKILGLSLAAVGLAGAAYAAAPENAADPLGDKTVTKAEFMTKHGEMFDTMDSNRDGKLDAADRAAHMAQRFDTVDADKNGSLSRDEFGAAHARGPKGNDTAQDGKHMRHGGGGHGMGMRMIGMADTNKDGSVTRAEFLTGAGQHFEMMDANKDGSLSAAERKAARGKMKGMRHGGQGGPGDHQMGDMPPPPPAN